MKFKFLKKEESGFILAFALIVVAVLLLISLSVSRIITKEIFFSRIIDNNRAAYFAADSGIECAQYIDNVLRDSSVNKSLILNSITTGDAKYEFSNNASNNVFFPESSVLDDVDSLNNVTCASDDGTYNRIFLSTADTRNAGYVSNRENVIENLNARKSSYTIVGNGTNATTTFGFVLVDGNNYRCVLVDFAKEKSPSSDITTSFDITSTGYSGCNPEDTSRVSRTIYRYSTD